MTTPEDKQQADLPASTPGETPRSEAADTTPADTADTLQQAEQAVIAPPGDDIAQSLPWRVPGKSVKTRILPERQAVDTSTSPAEESAEPAASLADLDWMPPAEDHVARFLSDVAEIAPPQPTREREGTLLPGFLLPATTSPEELERKKAKAQPFWSQVVATPMEQRATAAASAKARRAARKRAQRRTRLLVIACVLALLVIGALAIIVLTHPALLHLNVHL